MSARGSHARSARGFTLLETVIAMAILALALMAIFDMNSGAVSMHAYTKRLTVATLLARSKMTDIEQELYDKGFNADDDEMDGDFSDEGWPSFKWRAKIIAPKTDGVPPEQLIGAIFNIPMDGSDPLGALMGLGGAKAAEGGAQGAGGAGMAAAMGPLAGFATQQLTQMVQQITQSVREVHLTVSWKDGKTVESLDVVTHVVSLGPGSDRNGASGQGGTQPQNMGGANGWFNPKTQAPAVSPMPCQNDPTKMCEGGNPDAQLVPMPSPTGGQNQMINGFPNRPIGGLQNGIGNPNLRPGGVR